MARELVLLGIGGIFGLGATLVSLAAPLYFPNAPSWIWHWSFWCGLTLMALMIIDIALLFGWSRTPPKWIPAILINLGGCLIAAGFIWRLSVTDRPGPSVNFPYVGTLSSAEDPFAEHIGILNNFKGTAILNITFSIQKGNDVSSVRQFSLPILYQEGWPITFLEDGRPRSLHLGAGEFTALLQSQDGSFMEFLTLHNTASGLKREIKVIKMLPPGQGGNPELLNYSKEP